MKILYIAHDSSLIGGANRALVELIYEMKKNSIEVCVLVPNKGELTDKLDEMNVKFIIFNFGWWAYHKGNNKFVNMLRYIKITISQIDVRFRIGKLLKKLNNMDIDVIHTNSSIINIGAIISRKMNIKHIWHIREFGEEHLNMMFIYGVKRSREYMEKNSEVLVAISHSLADKYNRLLRNSKKVKIIYDGVSRKYLNYNFKNTEKGYLNLIMVANIQKGKGQLELLDQIEKLKNQKFNINLKLIGGIGEEQYYKLVKEKVDSLDDVVLLGSISSIDDINRFRTWADCEIVCSSNEAFGRVTVEAMMSCLPVIAKDSGANTELIKNKINGIIYRSDIDDSLMEGIKYMYDNNNELMSMGMRGYKIASENYTSENNASQIFEVYKNVKEEINESRNY